MHNAHDAQMHKCKHVRNCTEMYSRKHCTEMYLGRNVRNPFLPRNLWEGSGSPGSDPPRINFK